MTTTMLSGTLRFGATLAAQAAGGQPCVRRSEGLVSALQPLNHPYHPDLGLPVAALGEAPAWRKSDRRFEIAGSSQEDGRMR